jgi:hypothetical protein
MGLDWSTPNHGPIQSARRGLTIAGESNVSVKARKDNGDIDPHPVSSYYPPFFFKKLLINKLVSLNLLKFLNLRSSIPNRLIMMKYPAVLSYSFKLNLIISN